ncbi:di-trans,poly-cis-decaprenylcistransferase [bacterium]|nr:di-trans,poly-cis-decaprenylcistransferase [bacterium]
MKIPKHLGIILDGNRRWAKEKGLAVWEGHRRGVETTKKAINWAQKKGIKTLTLFVFSTENWKRKKKEIDFLMKLAGSAINNSLKEIDKNRIRVRIIGEKTKLPKSLREQIAYIQELTKKNKAMVLNLALSYGGRAEIVEAVKNLIKKKVPPEKIDEKAINENLWTSDVDLIIRTGKEQRLSNFLLWQSAYSELYFCKKYWPEINEKDLDNALLAFSRRKRRYGR